MMLPSNTSFTELEAVSIFKGVHGVTHVMRDVGLQFADESLKNPHLCTGYESGMFQGLHIPRDGREVMVEIGKALVRSELAFKMVSSQVASNTGDLVRATSAFTRWRGPFVLIGRNSATEQGKSDLPNNSDSCPINPVIGVIVGQSHISWLCPQIRFCPNIRRSAQ